MSAHLARAELLLEQNRPQDALAEVRQALNADTEGVDALLCLARCHSDLKQHPEAISAAQRAVSLAGDTGYPHRIHAYVLHQADRESEAEAAATEALRLDPEDEFAFIVRASIRLALRRWTDALADAESALTLSPESPEALNLRSIALTQLGRTAEAHTTGDYALNRTPDNGMSHAVKGWACLHQSRPHDAQPHFVEALRLEPDLEYARRGMLESLKATNPLYRGMLVYFLWMGRQSNRVQWVFILVTLFGVRFVRGIANQNPSAGTILWPLIGLFYGFIYLTWTAVPMFNFMLRLNRFGRHVLDADERRGSTFFGLSLLPLAAAGAWWAWGDNSQLDGLLATIYAAMLSVCVAASVQREGRNRGILFAATGVLAAMAIAVLFLGEIALAGPFLLCFLGFQFLANSLTK